MVKLHEFIPIHIKKEEAEKILHEKIDAHTWMVFNEFVTKNSKPQHLFRKWWDYWKKMNGDNIPTNGN